MSNAGACERLPRLSGSIQERIAELARSTQIVIINEAHNIPWHREMTRSLLEPLWDQGYRYLAEWEKGVSDLEKRVSELMTELSQ